MLLPVKQTASGSGIRSRSEKFDAYKNLLSQEKMSHLAIGCFSAFPTTGEYSKHECYKFPRCQNWQISCADRLKMLPLRLIAIASISIAVKALLVASTSSPDAEIVAALKLASGYSSAVRPPPDNGTANGISIFVHLSSLIKVDSASQEILLQAWLIVYWNDSRLAWLNRFNSSLDSTEMIVLPASMLWQPDVAFYDILSYHRVSDERVNLVLQNSGRVIRGTQLVVASKCPMQMFGFPYDAQTCEVLIGSSFQPSSMIRLRTRDSFLNMTLTNSLSRSNEFCITGVELVWLGGNPSETAALRISFSRMPTFYVINLMLPSILLLAISALAFRLPPDCGERVSFSITIVLSMCVFLQLAGNYTPTQSQSVPLITMYFSAAVLMTILNVLCNAFVISCHFRQHGSPVVSNRLVRALFLNRLVSGNFDRKAAAANSSNPKSQQVAESDSQVTDAPLEQLNEWARVVFGADRVFLGIFTAASVGIVGALVIIELSRPRANCLGGSLQS